MLGEVLHGSFENYASDENLPAEHWFWDRGKSGGIFVEHGVHFFDLFAGWLGPGGSRRPRSGSGRGPRSRSTSTCTVRYGDTALVNFYHGFHQAGRMDRQELRLVFERGDVTLYDWVPTRARIHALVDERQTRDLCDLFPGARLDVTASYGGKDRACRGRGKAIDAYQMIELSSGDGQAKSPLYGRLLRSMMEDQVAWIRDRNHRAGRHRGQRPRFARDGLRGRRAGPSGGGRPMTVRRLSTRLLLRPEDVPAVPRRLRGRRRLQPRGGPGGRRGRAPGPGGRAAPRAATGVHRPAAVGPGRTGLTVDWVPDAELEPIDPRVVRRKADGLVRLTFTSHLRVVRCGDGRAVREVTDVTFRPQGGGRGVRGRGPADHADLDGRFYFTYVAVSRHGPATALASTTDFRTFERHGVIFCPENKDVVLFPERLCVAEPFRGSWAARQDLRACFAAWGRAGAGPNSPARIG